MRPKLSRKNAIILESFNDTKTSDSSTGFAFYRSGCILQSINSTRGFSSEDSSITSSLITPKARVWMNFWKKFFKQLAAYDILQTSGIQDSHQSSKGGVLELMTVNNWLVIPGCKSDIQGTYIDLLCMFSSSIFGSELDL